MTVNVMLLVTENVDTDRAEYDDGSVVDEYGDGHGDDDGGSGDDEEEDCVRVVDAVIPALKPKFVMLPDYSVNSEGLLG